MYKRFLHHIKLCTTDSCIPSHFVLQTPASRHILYHRLLHPIKFCTTDSYIPSVKICTTYSCILSNSLLQTLGSHHILYYRLFHPIKFCTRNYFIPSNFVLRLFHPIKFCTTDSCIPSNFVLRLLHPITFCTTDSFIPSNSALQTFSSHQRLSRYTNDIPWYLKISSTTLMQENDAFNKVMKSSTKQLNMKPEILTEEQKHSAEISLKNSSQHSTAILCGRAFSKSPSINRNLQRMTPPSQINSITSTADSTGRTPPKLQATLALCRLCCQTQIQVSHHLPSPSSHGR